MGFVAIAPGRVEREKGAFGDAPGPSGLDAALLRIQAEAAALIEQAPPLERQEQRRHEIFEHRARPARQAAIAVLPQPRTRECAPVAARRLAPRDGKIAREHGLARQQIVPAARGAFAPHVPADHEQIARFIVKKGKIRLLRHPAQTGSKLFFPRLRGESRRDEQRGAAIAAVHGGNKGRGERGERACVVPVAEMPAAARQLLRGSREAAEEGDRLVPADHAEVAGRDGRRHRKAEVRGRNGVRRAARRAALNVVRRQIVVLPGAERGKVFPGVRGNGAQIGRVRRGKRFLRRGAQAERPGRERREQPHQAGRAADHRP